MKRKITVIVMTLVLTLTMITIPSNIKIKAFNLGTSLNDPGLDHTYIYNKTKGLSDIIENFDYRWRSREFGTLGEQQGAKLIESWMNDLNLTDVHNETINEEWNETDTWKFKSDNYVGNLSLKREFDEEDYYLKVWVYDKILRKNITWMNFTHNNSFPFLKGWWGGQPNLYPTTVRIFKRFKRYCIENQVIYIKNNQWAPKPYAWNNHFLRPCFLRARCKGFILGDVFSDTWFMEPSHKDHLRFGNGWFANHIKPGFSINGSDGDTIESYLNNSLRYNVYANVKMIWEHEHVTSYNVIGQINGTDTENVSLVIAHSDCWWSQGTIDEGAETALVLGIAKYIKDRELNLTHTVKFIATGAEEMGFRGAKDYIKQYKLLTDNPSETVKHVINPGNFGHEDRTFYDKEEDEWVDLKFTFSSINDYLQTLAGDIVDILDFEERTNISTFHNPDVEAEDSLPFSKTGVAEGTISFGRFPYKMYHRGGVTIDDGDTMDVLDNSSFEIESEVVASVALHLTVDSEHRFVNTSVIPYDSSGDGNNDSVKVWFNITTDTNTSLFGRIKGCLYDSNDNKIYLSEKESDLFYLKKNNTISGYLDRITLPFFRSNGDYTFRLKIMDYWDEVDDEYNETIYLYKYSKPVSDFDTHTSSLKARTFIDNSTPSPGATIVNWTWDFGDGNYSYQKNTSHSYYDDGNYTVSLTILDSDSNSNTTNKTIVVDNAIPNAIINISSNIQIEGNSVSFNSSSSDSDGSITNYTWDFGDETTDYTASSTHTYSNSGIYSVNLTITDDDGGINYTTKTMIVAGALADDNYQQDDPQNHSWDTVQEAINDVNDDDIIYVYNGNYSESLTINRSISLYGEDCKKVKIQSLGTVIDIVNESVNMDGFTIDGGTINIQINNVNNCSISNCDVNNSINGIKITSGSDNNTISQCNITNSTYGVFVSGSYNWIGSKNIKQLNNDSFFNQNRYGIYIDNSYDNMIIGCNIDATPPQTGGPPLASYGISLDDSENNSIFCTNIYNAGNTGYGIYLDDSVDNNICHNIIEDNDYGVFLTSSSDNHIAMNNISNNDLSGVTIIMMSSSNNYIYWNDFILNGHLIFPQAYDDGIGNFWNSSGNETLNYVSTGEGNYWSDCIGNDNDGDGIGDTSYLISGFSRAVDNYPVMKANEFKYS